MDNHRGLREGYESLGNFLIGSRRSGHSDASIGYDILERIQKHIVNDFQKAFREIEQALADPYDSKPMSPGAHQFDALVASRNQVRDRMQEYRLLVNRGATPQPSPARDILDFALPQQR